MLYRKKFAKTLEKYEMFKENTLQKVVSNI